MARETACIFGAIAQRKCGDRVGSRDRFKEFVPIICVKFRFVAAISRTSIGIAFVHPVFRTIFLQSPEQLRLRSRGRSPTFVQEQRTAVRHLKATDFLSKRPDECASRNRTLAFK